MGKLTGRGSSNGAGGPISAETSSLVKALPWSSICAGLVMIAFIFGGCCSNVYALEAIINFEPASGTLVTLVQFLFVAATGFIGHFDKTQPPFFVTRNQVPLRRWLVNIVLFFAINVLNNHAFSYDISVPVHIILRSGGSITTMIGGYLYGKRYSRVQTIAVALLSFGIALAAWSDAQSKAKPNGNTRPTFSVGLAIIFIAQVLSAIMGLYTEATYRKYGPHWKENLFYSHILSLPLFLPLMPSLAHDLRRLNSSAPFGPTIIPSQLVYLAVNVLTQYVCIRGVNLLAAKSSALTVTIVLNIRKLVSLLLSIWLFGNKLPSGTILGALVVFTAGGLYSLGSTKAVSGKKGVVQAKNKAE